MVSLPQSAPFLPTGGGRRASRPHFLGQSPGPSPSPPRPRPRLIFPSLQGAPSLVIHPRFLRRCDFPASQPSGYPALDGRWLSSLSWPPPCLGNADIRGDGPLRRGLIPYSPSLTPALQRPCLCRGTRLSWRPSFRLTLSPLPPSLWGAGGGEGGGWLPSVPVASFPCFSGPVPPQLPVLFKAAPGTSASLSPRAAHHAEPRRPCRLLWVHTFSQPVTWTGERPEHPVNTPSDTFICGRHVPLAA